MRKIAIVSPTQFRQAAGGAEYQLHILAEFLSKSGFDVHHASRGAIETCGEHVTGSNDSYVSHQIEVPDSLLRPVLGASLDTPWLYRLLHKLRPSIVIQRVASAQIAACALYARLHDVPMVWWVSSDKDLEPAANVGVTSPIRWLDRRLFRFGIAAADAIIVQSDFQRSIVSRRFPDTANYLVRNFHPIPEPRPAREAKCVVWVANVKPLKRPELFLDLAARFISKPGIRFVMVGRPYPGEWGQRVRERVDLAENVEWLGEQTAAEVNELLSNASLLVNTSEYEGFPNTFIQAWARCVPVATLGIDPDGVIGRENIGVVDKSVDDLASSIGRLIEDTPTLREMGKRAYRYAKQNHSLSNLDVFAGLLSKVESRASRG